MENAYHRQVQKQKAAYNEKFNNFFSSLTSRVTNILKPPDPTTEAYVFPSNIIDNNPVLITSMYMLLDGVGAEIQNTCLRRLVARELLQWLTRERPDVVYEMLQG